MRITSSLAKLFKESVFRVEEVFTPKESHYIIPNGGSRTSWWCPGPVHTCYHVCAGEHYCVSSYYCRPSYVCANDTCKAEQCAAETCSDFKCSGYVCEFNHVCSHYICDSGVHFQNVSCPETLSCRDHTCDNEYTCRLRHTCEEGDSCYEEICEREACSERDICPSEECRAQDACSDETCRDHCKILESCYEHECLSNVELGETLDTIASLRTAQTTLVLYWINVLPTSVPLHNTPALPILALRRLAEEWMFATNQIPA